MNYTRKAQQTFTIPNNVAIYKAVRTTTLSQIISKHLSVRNLGTIVITQNHSLYNPDPAPCDFGCSPTKNHYKSLLSEKESITALEVKGDLIPKEISE